MKLRFNTRVSSALTASIIMLALTACGSTPTKQNNVAPYDKSMSQAETYARSGSTDQALSLYQEAARANPAIKDPWLKIAQINFDRGNYGAAVVAAEEVLKRSPSDANADSILTVSGLRIAVQSLTRLRAQPGGSAGQGQARVDAEILARKLRDTLGDRLLVPRPAVAAKPVMAKPAATSKPKPATAAPKSLADALAPSTPAPKAAPPPKKEESNDPFSSLK
jgi:tetratricopeptide (TPR) repeat protein